jgi:hypothetical protein
MGTKFLATKKKIFNLVKYIKGLIIKRSAHTNKLDAKHTGHNVSETKSIYEYTVPDLQNEKQHAAGVYV